MLEYSFGLTENHLKDKISDGLDRFFGGQKPVIVCVGTDLSIGDSLGPIVGTMLYEYRLDAFVYGRLSETITAKDVRSIKTFLEKAHPTAKTLIVDAAIGEKNDVGSIKLSLAPIRPGLGANKDLPKIGTVNLIGIVAERSCANYSFLNLTRLSPVYEMARKIADGIADYFVGLKSDKKIRTFKAS
jgi:putative sporulation protein YyaC